MVRAERTANTLDVRGSDTVHHLHVTQKGDPGFVELAYDAASMDEPGGGTRA